MVQPRWSALKATSLRASGQEGWGSASRTPQHKSFRPIDEAMAKQQIDRKELQEHLYARHSQERNMQIRKIDLAKYSRSGGTDAQPQTTSAAPGGSQTSMPWPSWSPP